MLRKWFKKLGESAGLENRRVILNLLEANKSARLLDLGYGDGSLTLEMGRRIGTDQVYGVDIRQCKTKGIKAYRSDLNEPLPFGDESFDVVNATDVLEHIPHTDLFLRQIHRVLRRDGYAVISTPNLAGWHNIACLFLGWQPFVAELSDEISLGNPLTNKLVHTYPRHHRIATYRGLRELLQYHGFKVEKIVGTGYYPFPVRVARLLSRIDPRHAVRLTVKARKA